MTSPNPTDEIRVIVVDDDAIVRHSLASILGSQDDLTIVATATNGAEAVDLVHEV